MQVVAQYTFNIIRHLKYIAKCKNSLAFTSNYLSVLGNLAANIAHEFVLDSIKQDIDPSQNNPIFTKEKFKTLTSLLYCLLWKKDLLILNQKFRPAQFFVDELVIRFSRFVPKNKTKQC